LTCWISGQIKDLTISISKISKNLLLKPLPVLLWCKYHITENETL
jgi:hypothetical protein